MKKTQPVTSMAMGAPERGLTHRSPREARAAGRVQGAAPAAEIAVEVGPEDATHAVQSDGVHARVEEAEQI